MRAATQKTVATHPLRYAIVSVIIKTFSSTREKSVELYNSPSLFWSLFVFSFKVFEEYSNIQCYSKLVKRDWFNW